MARGRRGRLESNKHCVNAVRRCRATRLTSSRELAVGTFPTTLTESSRITLAHRCQRERQMSRGREFLVVVGNLVASRKRQWERTESTAGERHEVLREGMI